MPGTDPFSVDLTADAEADVADLLDQQQSVPSADDDYPAGDSG